jgi:CRISPR/Cas system-associated protein Cas10 (large subunit of type III CRISPR-Cas system)
MTLITDEKRLCPVCGHSQADTDFETRTSEQEFHCQNKDCGFQASTEIRTDDNGRRYWVETTWFPITADGKVQRGSLDKKRNREEQPK